MGSTATELELCRACDAVDMAVESVPVRSAAAGCRPLSETAGGCWLGSRPCRSASARMSESGQRRMVPCAAGERAGGEAVDG